MISTAGSVSLVKPMLALDKAFSVDIWKPSYYHSLDWL